MTIPNITSISPASGPVTGGTQVTIFGSGLSSANLPADILFSDTPAASIVSVTDTALVAVAPAAATPGTVAISVVTPNGTVLWDNGFSYSNNVTIKSILPASGPTTGGTNLTITGVGFLQVYSIQFNDTPALTMVVASDTQLTVQTPAATASGPADISLFGLTGDTLYIEFGGFNYTAASTTTTSTTPAGGTTPTTTTPTAPSTTSATSPTSTTTSTTAAPTGSGTTSGTTAPPGSGTTSATQPTAPPSGGQQTGSGTAATQTSGGQPAAGQTTSGQAGAAVPQPGNYIPGGAMIVPGGQTGLGGSAGTGAGFGVGTLMAGGGGSAPPSNLPYYVDPGLTAQLVQTLIGLVQSAASPDALEAQNMILRRMALEGDVVGSRIPPPRNISEIGGYLNLLGTLKETTMREQALAGILGVAGPAVPLGWITNDLPLSMVAVSNDRPPVAAQASFPLSVLVRSDFVAGVEAAFKTLHGYGATLPLTSPSVILLPPGGTGATIPQPVLFYLGRTLMIAPSAALANPNSDPVAIVTSDGANYYTAAQVLNPATFGIPPTDLEALQCTPTSSTSVQLSQVEYVPLAPFFEAAGYYPLSPLPLPVNSTQTSWAWMTNTTGLVSGVTRLGDELSFLYRQDLIAASAFAAMLSWTWNGTTFAAS